MICLPIGPKCDSCELNDGLCPSARKVVKASTSKSRSKKVSSTSGPKIEVELEEDTKVAVEATLTPTESQPLYKIEPNVKEEDLS